MAGSIEHLGAPTKPLAFEAGMPDRLPLRTFRFFDVAFFLKKTNIPCGRVKLFCQNIEYLSGYLKSMVDVKYYQQRNKPNKKYYRAAIDNGLK
jgi:hypothetical protein